MSIANAEVTNSHEKYELKEIHKESMKKFEDYMKEDAEIYTIGKAENFGESDMKISVSTKDQEYWLSGLIENPKLLFEKENLIKLKEGETNGVIEPWQRWVMLYNSVRSLKVSRLDVNKYFEIFPADLTALRQRHYSKKEDVAAPVREKDYLEGISSYFFPKDYPFSSAQDWIGSKGSRIHADEKIFNADQYLLEGYKVSRKDQFTDTGAAYDDFMVSLKEAKKYAFSDHTNKVGRFKEISSPFGENYDKLSDKQKSDYVRAVIIRLQYNILSLELTDSFDIGYVSNSYDAGYAMGHRITGDIEKETSTYLIDIPSIDMRGRIFFGGFSFHYLMKKALIEMASISVDREENIELLLDFYQKNRDPLFATNIAKALAEIDIAYASKRLLELVRSDEGDSQLLASMLYRLEFGKIGISDEGFLQYFDQLYDVSKCEYEDQDGEVKLVNSQFSAMRLDSNGRIVFIDENGHVAGYSVMNDLSFSDDPKELLKLSKIVYDDLYLIPEDQLSPEIAEARQKAIKVFHERYVDVRAAFDNDFSNSGITLANFTTQEANYILLMYVNKGENQDVLNKLVEFARKYGQDGIKVFIAMEINEDAGEAILDLANKLDEFVAQLIFNKATQIADYAYVSDSDLSKDFFSSERGIHPHYHILSESYSILIDIYKRIKDANSEEIRMIEVELKALLDQIHVMEKIFNACFKTAVETEEGIDLTREIRRASLKKRLVKDLDPTYKDKLTQVVYDNHPEGDGSINEQGLVTCSPDYQQKIFDNFNRLMNTGSDDVFIYDFRGNISDQEEKSQENDVPLGFMVIELIRDDQENIIEKRAWAFNINQNHRFIGMGKEMLQQAFFVEVNRPDGPEGQKVKTNAVSMLYNPISMRYIEKEGFVAVGAKDYEGNRLLNMMYDEKVLNNSEARKRSKEELMAYPAGEDQGGFLVRRFERKEDIDLTDLTSGSYNMISRFFRDADGAYYCVFENDPEIDQKESIL